jgi:hypothetical protein
MVHAPLLVPCRTSGHLVKIAHLDCTLKNYSQQKNERRCQLCGLYFPDADYFAGFRLDEMSLSARLANRRLKQTIGVFARVIIEFVPDHHMHAG